MARETTVVSVRLPDSEVEGLRGEADDLDFDSVNKYVEYLLKHRDPPDEMHPLGVYQERLNDLEDRVHDLEARLDNNEDDADG